MVRSADPAKFERIVPKNQGGRAPGNCGVNSHFREQFPDRLTPATRVRASGARCTSREAFTHNASTGGDRRAARDVPMCESVGGAERLLVFACHIFKYCAKTGGDSLEDWRQPPRGGGGLAKCLDYARQSDRGSVWGIPGKETQKRQ